MNSFAFAKLLFYAACVSSAIGLAFGFGLYSGVNKTTVYEFIKEMKVAVDDTWTLFNISPQHFLQPARYPGSGVTVNESPDQDSVILMSGFFEDSNELRLIRRNGEIIARWPARYSEIFHDSSHVEKEPATDWNVDTHGALALPDGSVVFNFSYFGLVKLGRCGKVVWTLAHPTHHSVERAEGGGFWVAGQRKIPGGQPSPYRPFKTPINDHTAMKVSEDGKILTEISVPGLFYENGIELESILTSAATMYSMQGERGWNDEIVHLNKVAELTSHISKDFPMFEAGDLLLSMRQLNLIMIADPDTRKIKWWKIGPWLRQHDPEFKAGGTITVFNNNAYTGLTAGKERTTLSMPRETNIVEIDPTTNQYWIAYGGKAGQEMLSLTRGKQDVTEEGGLLITEFDGGRVFETNAQGKIIWEFVNRVDSDEVAEITEARVYPRGYFEVSDWSCDEARS